MTKCARSICTRKGVYQHRYNLDLYCTTCAVTIDEACRRYGEPLCFELINKEESADDQRL